MNLKYLLNAMKGEKGRLSKTRPYWQLLAPFKAAQVIQIAILWKTVTIMKTEMCTITCANVQFKVQRQVVEAVSRHCMYSCQVQLPVATRKFQYIAHACRKRMEVGWITGSSANA